MEPVEPLVGEGGLVCRLVCCLVWYLTADLTWGTSTWLWWWVVLVDTRSTYSS